MNRKFVLLAVSSVFVWCLAPSTAQEQGASEEQVEAARALIREGALQIVQEELPMTDAERAAFWSVYEKYRAELLEVENT